MKNGAYVYSTMSQSVAYAFYKPKVDPSNLHEEEYRVVINGGANVITKKTLITPKGVATRISEDQFQALMYGLKKPDGLERPKGIHPVLKQHMDNGYIIVEKIKENPNKVAKNMTPRDGSAQHTDADLKRLGIELLEE
jgi:hypothetical protein